MNPGLRRDIGGVGAALETFGNHRRRVVDDAAAAGPGADDEGVAQAAEVEPVFPAKKESGTLAEKLADPVKGYRSLEVIIAQGFFRQIVAECGHGTGEQYLAHTIGDRTFEQFKHGRDIDLEGALRILLTGLAQHRAEVENPFRTDAGDDLSYPADPGQVILNIFDFRTDIEETFRVLSQIQNRRFFLTLFQQLFDDGGS